jgi:hypothetical protein
MDISALQGHELKSVETEGNIPSPGLLHKNEAQKFPEHCAITVL